jgi:adenine/guanine phosphoribosyltransferase-like PRPP-binding protein
MSLSDPLFEALHDKPLRHFPGSDNPYLVTMFTDSADEPATPEVTGQMILEFRALIEEITKQHGECDVIVGDNHIGGHIAALVSFYAARKPFTLFQREPLSVPGEIEIPCKWAFGEWPLYLNGVKPGQRAILVDDMFDSGGTAIAMINGLRNAGLHVLGSLAVYAKNDPDGLTKIAKATGIEPRVLAKVDVKGRERSRVTWRHSLHSGDAPVFV